MPHIPMSHSNDTWISQWVMSRIPRSQSNEIAYCDLMTLDFIQVCALFVCVAWLIYTCGMALSYVWHDTFICVAWFRVPWRIHTCGVTYFLMWHDSFICVTWHIYIFDVYAHHESCGCVNASCGCVNESCHTHEGQIWIRQLFMSQKTRKESYEWVDESCHRCQGKSHMNESTSHVTDTKERVIWMSRRVMSQIPRKESHEWVDESCHRYQGKSHMDESTSHVTDTKERVIWMSRRVMSQIPRKESYEWVDELCIKHTRVLSYKRAQCDESMSQLNVCICIYLCKMNQWVMSHTSGWHMKLSTSHATHDKELVIWMSQRVIWMSQRFL